MPTGASTSAAAAASANASASPGATPSTATAAAAGGTESGGEPANRVHYKATHRTVMKNWDLPDDFPNAQVVRAYMVPNVDSDKSKFEFGRPDSDLLATFCQERFGWSTVRLANEDLRVQPDSAGPGCAVKDDASVVLAAGGLHASGFQQPSANDLRTFF